MQWRWENNKKNPMFEDFFRLIRKVSCSNFIVCPQVLFHLKTLYEPATIQRLCSVLDKSTGEIVQKKPR